MTEGDEVILDGADGALVLRPEAAVWEAYERAAAARALRAAGWAKLRDTPSVTKCGTSFRLMMNAGLPQELPQLYSTGAEGIGLFRTEIAMMARGACPMWPNKPRSTPVCSMRRDRRYCSEPLIWAATNSCRPRAPREENPAWAGAACAWARPPSRAAPPTPRPAAAAGGRDLSVMFPMVANLAEFRQAKGLLYAEAARVRPAPAKLIVGTCWKCQRCSGNYPN